MTAALTTGNANLDAALAAALAVGGAAASTNPYVAVGGILLSEGLSFWADFQARQIAGQTTLADLEEAASKISPKLARLRQHVEEAEAAEAKAAEARAAADAAKTPPA